MPSKWFLCPDEEQIEITQCLKHQGCRMKERCASLRYLNAIAFDREWRGITASMAGNGPRLIYLKRVKDYAIDPQDRVFAVLGTGSHANLHHHAPLNVLSEEVLKEGTPDCLEQDEYEDGKFILYDDKTWGSYRVMRALGIVKKKTYEPILDKEENPVLLKSGPNKGKPKTKSIITFEIDPNKIDLLAEELQLNRYRIAYESRGFPISKMFLEVPVRDGGVQIAQTRNIDRKLYKIPIQKLDNTEVEFYYTRLDTAVEAAILTNRVRICNAWESWDGRRCNGFCEVSEYCKEMGE